MARMLRYPGKVVIVTGGTRGIGEGIVRKFVLEGAKVVFCAPESERERGICLQKELEESGGPGEACFQVCDVRLETDIKTLVSVTVDMYGCLDCLVNNAGAHPPYQTIDNVTAQEFRNLIEINEVGYFLTAKYSLPHLRKTEGNIVNVASIVNIIGEKNAVAYVATKGAVTAMTKALAIDESKYGVRVNCISPANIWTSMWATLASQAADPEAAIQRGKDVQLLGRMGTPAECAAAVLYLASEGTFCTGVDLLLTGGAELGYGLKSHQSADLDTKG